MAFFSCSGNMKLQMQLLKTLFYGQAAHQLHQLVGVARTSS